MILNSFLLAISMVINGAAGFNNNITILCYHALNSNKSPYSFTVDELDTQMSYFAERGYKFVSWGEIKEGKISGKKNIFVTVDDGNKSVYEAYYKVFKKHGIKPMLGIYPAIIEKKDYALTWKQVKELSDAGCDIAAHGYNHLYVNQKLYDTNPKAFKNETALSKKILEEKLGIKIEAFIYPFGVRSQVTIDTLKKLGYKSAFTIVPGETIVPLAYNSAPYELHRYMITRPSWKSTFGVIVKKTSGKEKRSVAESEKKDIQLKLDAGVEVSPGRNAFKSAGNAEKIEEKKDDLNLPASKEADNRGLFSSGNVLYAAENEGQKGKKDHQSAIREEPKKKGDLSFLDKQVKFVKENFSTMGEASYGYYSMWNRVLNSKIDKIDRKKDSLVKDKK